VNEDLYGELYGGVHTKLYGAYYTSSSEKRKMGLEDGLWVQLPLVDKYVRGLHEEIKWLRSLIDGQMQPNQPDQT
jgi:hypothetical protein